MTSAWESIRNDARRSARYQVRLSASVFIFKGINEAQSAAVLAHTRDVSREGLSLVMPDGSQESYELKGEPLALRISLKLPSEVSVKLVGVSVYHIPYKRDNLGRQFLVGVKLEQSEELANYREYIESLDPLREIRY